MALIDCHCFSEVLGLSVTFSAIVPQQTKGQIGMAGKARDGRHPTLLLLHGMSDDHSIWLRRTSIERYASECGLAVVMPAVQRSFYTDMAHGPRYWTFISEEIPELARGILPLSDRREDNFVAGLSMGGYGAFKLALRRPEAFAAAASLSGALDVAGMMSENVGDEMRCIFGEPETVAGSENDLIHLLQEANPASLPALYQCCGTEDRLHPQNVRFVECARKVGVEVTYREGPGDHNWAYWDARIQDVLAWLREVAGLTCA